MLYALKSWRKGQWQAIERMFGQPAHALFADIGSGKTIMLLGEAMAAWQAGLIDGALIVSWNGVHRDWLTDQLHRVTRVPCDVSWTPDWPVHPLARGNGPVFYAMHREAMTVKRYRVAAKQFLKSGRMAFIWDESQDIRTPRAKRTRIARMLAPLAVYRRIASGFPDPSGMHNLYSQYTFLSPDILGLKTFGAFKAEYVELKAGFQGHPVIAGYKNQDRFAERVRPYTTHVEQDRRGRAPAKTVVRHVELTREQRKHWDDLKREFTTLLKSGERLDVPLAITRLIRLQQLTCGWFPLEDGSYEYIPENRTRALLETLEECRGKVVIWSRFVHCIPRLAQRIGKQAVYVYGAVKQANRDSLLKRFRDDDKVRVLIAQPETVGTGRNEMVVADKDIFWSNDFKALTRRQAEGRLDRDGQCNVVTHIDIVARDSYDEKILNTLRNRRDISEELRKRISDWR